MKIDVYNQEGKVVGDAALPKDIFDVKLNTDLVHQVAVSMFSNKRQSLAHAKTRAEVRGGGKKPWRQKGTGRARHGSIRSPLWKGGGVTFGPRNEKVFEKDIPKKMRRKALLMVLSEKARGSHIVVLDKLEFEKAKTKNMAAALSKLPCKEQSTLIILPDYDKSLFLAARNIKKIKVEEARNLNVLELLNYKYLMMLKATIKTIEKTFIKKEV